MLDDDTSLVRGNPISRPDETARPGIRAVTGGDTALSEREQDVLRRETEIARREGDVARREQESRKPKDDEKGGDEGKSDDKGKSDEKEGDKPDEDDDEKESTVRKIWRKHPLAVMLSVAGTILAIVLIGLYWWFFLHPYESTDDAFIDSREFAIAPKVAGYISEVMVTDNQFVGSGSPVLQIDDRDYRVALEQAEAQIAGSRATLEGLAAQIAGQEASVEEAKAQVVQAQAQLQFAQQDASRYQDLAQKGAGTVQQAQQSTQNLQVSQATLARAQATVTAQQKQITALLAQQTNGGANVQVAQSQLDQARLNLTYTTVVAAQAGTVVRLSAAKGAYAQAGQNLTMFVPAQIWITANYKETQITDMRPGQPVDVKVDAYRGRIFKAHIDSVQPGSGTAFSLLPAENATGNYVKVVQRIPVKIVFDEVPRDVVLGPGMSVVPYARVR